jgi:VWFA-related protein
MIALLALAATLAEPQSGIRNTQTVVIDAVVSDTRGRTVDTLKVQDFELREDGNVLQLDEVRFIRDEQRVVAVYLDEYHVSAGEATDRVRAALTEFIDHELGAKDLFVVMKPLDSLLTIEMTHDRPAARAIVENFTGRMGDYAPRTDYERQFIAGTPPRIEAARSQVVWSALNALAVHLGTLGSQRKTLIVVTEGLPRADRRRGQETLPSLDAAIRASNHANVAVYGVDPGMEPLDPAPTESLRRLTVDTDGLLISGDLGAGLRGAIADATGYYLLTYHASHPADGKFHDVQVHVKRTGAQLHARKGYFAPSPDDALRAAVLARLNNPKPAGPVEPAPHASPLIQPWFGWSRGGGGTTRVTFVWEPAARVPGDRSKKIPTRLTLTALAADGTVLFEGPVAPTGAGTLDEPGAVPTRAVFEAPPGRVKLRMAIHDAAAQLLDRDVRDIVVRDLKGEVAIGTPEVLRARNARELRTVDESGVPVVSREFSRAEQLLVRVPVYGPSGAQPRVSAKLLSRMGQAMRDLSVTAPSGSDTFDQIALPLAGLAQGEYMIEVTATIATGEAKDRINFRVTP